MAEAERYYEITVEVTDAQGNQSTAHGEYKTTEAEIRAVAKEAGDALAEGLGAGYRSIDADT